MQFTAWFLPSILEKYLIMEKTILTEKIQKKTLLLKSILSIQVLFLIFVFIGCNGCGVGKKISTETGSSYSSMPKTDLDTQKSDSAITSQGVTDPNWKPDAQIPITRSFMGRNVTFKINPDQPGGEDIKLVYQDTLFGVSTHRRWVFNQITQLSPTVLLYSEFPKEVDKDFYYNRQPMRLEFMDSSYNTIKKVDIWKDRPYQEVGNKRLTFYNFDDEGMEVIPYKNQKTSLEPNEKTLFTSVRAEGKHVIVNYELRSLITNQNGNYSYSKIIGVKHTLYIFDLEGNLLNKLIDLPSVDGAVVSNNGKYMMFTFGGIGLATANNPFGTIEREGWALMRLSDQKIVYKEYTDDGILAFNRLWMDQGTVRLSYSTPSTEYDYDYWVFFDDENVKLYNIRITAAERKQLRKEVSSRREQNRFKYFKERFQLIEIPFEK
jgi:hypothetical protein